MSDPSYRMATREELDVALSLAAAEGWNPGLDDADIFWRTDPEGFVVVELADEVVGTGSIVSYGDFGFMGFFIVKKELRQQGIGRGFWRWRKETLERRLKPGAAIGLDGVFDMQSFYARGGFVFTHRNLRMEGLGHSSTPPPNISALSSVPFEQIAALDRRCFGFSRNRFLRRWIEPKYGLAVGATHDGQLKGYGVIRQCRHGYKIGPLFAEDHESAEDIFLALSNYAAGQAIYLDIPENNPAAVALANQHNMTEVFGCARMYAGGIPALPWESIYGITTFELG